MKKKEFIIDAGCVNISLIEDHDEARDKRFSVHRKKIESLREELNDTDLKISSEFGKLKKHYESNKMIIETKLKREENLLDDILSKNDEYKIPNEADFYTVMIKNDIFNIHSFYSLFLVQNNELISFHDLGWQTRVSNGKVEIFLQNNIRPAVGGRSNMGEIDFFLSYPKEESPVGKGIVIFYEDTFDRIGEEIVK